LDKFATFHGNLTRNRGKPPESLFDFHRKLLDYIGMFHRFSPVGGGST
jgi:hypothetical protein